MSTVVLDLQGTGNGEVTIGLSDSQTDSQVPLHLIGDVTFQIWESLHRMR